MIELSVDKGYVNASMVEEFSKFEHSLYVALNWKGNANNMRLIIGYFLGTHLIFEFSRMHQINKKFGCAVKNSMDDNFDVHLCILENSISLFYISGQ